MGAQGKASIPFHFARTVVYFQSVIKSHFRWGKIDSAHELGVPGHRTPSPFRCLPLHGQGAIVTDGI